MIEIYLQEGAWADVFIGVGCYIGGYITCLVINRINKG